MMGGIADPERVVAFWAEIGPKGWFERNAKVDRQISERFADSLDAAADGDLNGWLDQANSALALILVLDQFPRNMFRGSARAFAYDAMAVEAAEAAIAAGHDRTTDMPHRQFFYLPFMHSEILEHQDRCVSLNEAIDNESGVKFALIHREAIDKFGRFPHRNHVLGRVTTLAEAEYLASGGFSA